VPINKVTAAEAGAKKPRRNGGRRVEKSTHVEDKQVRLPDGTSLTVRLYARAGAIGIGKLTEEGDLVFIPLRRVRTHRNRDKSGRYRWYNDQELPESYGGGIVTVRLHDNNEDDARGFNRTENVRPIPPSDDDFPVLYARRNDAESINRGVEDSMYLRRAHSFGHASQHVNLLGTRCSSTRSRCSSITDESRSAHPRRPDAATLGPSARPAAWVVSESRPDPAPAALLGARSHPVD
jgi:hypothetical protein